MLVLSIHRTASPSNFIRKPKALWRAVSYGQIHPLLPTNGTFAFILITFIFTMVLTWGIRPYYRPPNWGSAPLALRSEFFATAVIPWIILFSLKRNPLRMLSGITTEVGQDLHKWFGWGCLFYSLIHTISESLAGASSLSPWSVQMAKVKFYDSR